MAVALSPFARKGLPAPYLITPRTTEEATCGKATLIAAGDFDLLIRAIRRLAPERTDLIEKFQDLRRG